MLSIKYISHAVHSMIYVMYVYQKLLVAWHSGTHFIWSTKLLCAGPGLYCDGWLSVGR